MEEGINFRLKGIVFLLFFIGYGVIYGGYDCREYLIPLDDVQDVDVVELSRKEYVVITSCSVGNIIFDLSTGEEKIRVSGDKDKFLFCSSCYSFGNRILICRGYLKGRVEIIEVDIERWQSKSINSIDRFGEVHDIKVVDVKDYVLCFVIAGYKGENSLVELDLRKGSVNVNVLSTAKMSEKVELIDSVKGKVVVFGCDNNVEDGREYEDMWMRVDEGREVKVLPESECRTIDLCLIDFDGKGDKELIVFEEDKSILIYGGKEFFEGELIRKLCSSDKVLWCESSWDGKSMLVGLRKEGGNIEVGEWVFNGERIELKEKIKDVTGYGWKACGVKNRWVLVGEDGKIFVFYNRGG